MCTNFLLTVPTDPGILPAGVIHVSARCLELSGHMPTSIYRIPRRTSFPLTKQTPSWMSNPVRWTNRFGFVAIANPEAFAEMPCFMDGINERGLSFGALWLPGTQFPATSPDLLDQLAFYDLGAWVLGQFETVGEVRAALARINPVGPPVPTEKNSQSQYVPLHFIVTDAAGKSLVIEFVGGRITLYPRLEHEGETDDGVLTNAPTYDWQRANLANYSHLSVMGPATSVVSSGPPVGSGLWGLPGDPMSASRFVKAAVMRQGYSLLQANGQGWLPAPAGGSIGYAGSEQTVVNAAMQLVQIIQATPYGTLLQQPSSSSDTPTVGDWTMWSVVRDHTHRKLYFTTAFSGIMRMIDLAAINFDNHDEIAGFGTVALLPPPASWYEEATFH